MQHTCSLGTAEKRQGFVERVASLDIGENERIGLTVDGRVDAFSPHILHRARAFHIERTVDDALSEASFLGQVDDFLVTNGERECLLADFLRAVDE